MDAAELQQRRKAAGLTQAGLSKKPGLHRDVVKLMERGLQPIADCTALSITSFRADPPSADVRPAPTLTTTDPMEQLIEAALIDSDVRFFTDRDGCTDHHLDFHLPDHDVAIEVKRFHSDRIGEQMKRAPNVIAVQGEVAVRFLADAIRGGRFLPSPG